uniref:Putative LOV domain-containing protein n=1 Tax=Linum tenuifolium TaxID=586397 RepID=A0A126X315_9ROSI|nr:putative LOV domain-containing protein [Linum tenuifolium]
MEPQLGLIEQSFNSRYSNWAREALDELPDNFTITDPCISGHPIVFASRGFLKMSGYSRDQVIGRNGRVFQGPNTCRRSVMEIREAIREEREVEINLLNYRKDGTPFWMLFRMTPVFGKDEGRVIHFVAVQVPILRRRQSRRNGGRLCDEILSNSCRREVCSTSSAGVSASDSGCRALEIEEQCEAGDTEKQIAATAIRNILSVLTHYSQSTRRLVCEKRFGPSFVSSSLHISLGRIKQSFVLMDPHLPDIPIVYASDAFLQMTGYARNEVLGHNCRFLDGVDTDPSVLHQIKLSIQAQQACSVRILHYRKDKSSFWNLLHISPVRNATGKIAYFVGVQIEEGSLDRHGLSPEMRQLSVVGSIKVAVRSSSMSSSSSSKSS